MSLIGKSENGAPGEIRTPGLLVRSQALYPTELRAHGQNKGKPCGHGPRPDLTRVGGANITT
jgi:hypothetical protein